MGYALIDQYSLLHFSTGVLAYFWGISLKLFIILHVAFEYAENTEWGMHFINNFSNWPGGKKEKDSFVNSMIGDNFFAILGWLAASYLDYLGTKYNWYEKK